MTKAFFGLPEEVVFVSVVLSQTNVLTLQLNLKMLRKKKKQL